MFNLNGFEPSTKMSKERKKKNNYHCYW